MKSPLDLMKRCGVGGGLVPFFKLVGVYFVVGAGSEAGAGAVAAKCAPVLALLLLVALAPTASTLQPSGGYGRRVCVGLALSTLGDALLLWPQHFVAGMAAFSAAHVAYLCAFRGGAGGGGRAAVAGAACYLATAAYLLLLLRPPGALRVLVPAYAALLATMAWRAVARGGAAAVGALLFLLSDGILGYSLFGGPVPYKQVLVMSTYYLGQLGIALSALQPARTLVRQ